MNKTPIEYVKYSCNPITGCRNGCDWCYARRMFRRFGKSFDPMFYPSRLKEFAKKRKPSRIFVGSVTDFWSPGVKQEWRNKVWDAMIENSRHTYLVLTKQPHRIPKNEALPRDLWLGVSITRQDELWRWEAIKDLPVKVKFISFEPLLEPITFGYIQPDWVIIGALTGSKEKTNLIWVKELLKQISISTPIFLKDNLNWHMKMQEYPK